MASTAALLSNVRQAIKAKQRTSLSGLRSSDLSPKAILEAALAGDTVAIEAIARIGRNLGLGASWLVNLFGPSALIIAGSLAECGELLLNPLRETLSETAMTPICNQLSVRTSILAQDAEVRGAVLLAVRAAELHNSVVYHA